MARARCDVSRVTVSEVAYVRDEVSHVRVSGDGGPRGMVSHVTVSGAWEGEGVTCNGVLNNAVLYFKHVMRILQLESKGVTCNGLWGWGQCCPKGSAG